MFLKIAITIKKDYAEALANFQKSYSLLTEENSDKYDRREVFTFTAACYEKLGEIDRAIEFYKKTLDLFPQDGLIMDRIDF